MPMWVIRTSAIVMGLLLCSSVIWAGGSTKTKTSIILDTDIGSDIDDAFALALAVASPQVDLLAVTTVGGQAEDRAWIVCRFLAQVGRKEVPVAFGRAPQPDYPIDWPIQYRRHP